ncbi:MAG: helix-turn-helix transcriptional regulator [Clostridia bacterium]|nr:helix-turn-helix transcriptional regulator [Clostridia bacterium]
MEIMHHEIGRDALYKIWNTIPGAMIIYIYTEGGNIVFADQIFPMKKGTLCFIGPDTPHYTMPDIPARYDRSKIFLSFEAVRHLLNALPADGGMQRLFLGNSVIYAQIPPELQEEVERVFAQAAAGRKEGLEELVACSFFQLMVYLKKYTVQPMGSPDDFLFRAVEYINRSYAKRITLEDVCEVIHVSKYHFCRRFKSLMGMTVMEYIQETRIAAAKTLLLNSELRIEEIAEQCGFSGLSYFSQIFKQRTGISATQYRRSHGDAGS